MIPIIVSMHMKARIERLSSGNLTETANHLSAIEGGDRSLLGHSHVSVIADDTMQTRKPGTTSGASSCRRLTFSDGATDLMS